MERLRVRTAGHQPDPVRKRQPQNRRHSRPQRWRNAVETLTILQGEYQEWLDSLPETLEDSLTAEMLREFCALGLDSLNVELLRGYGRD